MPMPQLESLAHESRWKTLQYMGDILEKRKLLRLGHTIPVLLAHPRVVPLVFIPSFTFPFYVLLLL